MAGMKISALTAVSSALLTDFFPVVQGGVTKRETLSQVATLFNSNLTFLPLAGGAMTGAVNMGAFKISNAADPTLAQDLATKFYVDSVAQGLTIQGACRVATTASLTAIYNNGSSGVGATLTNAGVFAALEIDNVVLAVGNRVLVKNPGSSLQNGIYTVTVVGDGVSINWVMTRALDYDQVADIQPGDLVLITEGTLNANSSWIETATVLTIGTSPINFVQFSASLPVSVPNGGTGRATSTTAYGLIAAGTTATGALQTIATGSTGQILQSAGSSALPTYTTSTYPATNPINTLLYASSANVIAALPTANRAVLVTDSGGIPSLSTGQIPGTATNDNANAGNIGEYISSTVSSGAAVSMPNAVDKTITSISLTAGDWDVETFMGTVVGVGSIISAITIGPSLTDNVEPLENALSILYNPLTANNVPTINGPRTRFSLASTTTIYLVGEIAFTVSTASAFGHITARRVR